MCCKSYNKFIKYLNLNEISKFSNLQNIYSFSSIKSICVWLSLDLSLEKSRLLYYSKGLLGIFLIYLITNKYPTIRSSKDQKVIYIESTLISSDLINFLEKFLIIYSSKQRKVLIEDFKINNGFIRFLVMDLNLFSDLYSFINFFELIELLYIDILCNHEENSRNFLFLDNIFKSSYII
jgi:hypothetical protein